MGYNAIPTLTFSMLVRTTDDFCSGGENCRWFGNTIISVPSTAHVYTDRLQHYAKPVSGICLFIFLTSVNSGEWLNMSEYLGAGWGVICVGFWKDLLTTQRHCNRVLEK